MQMLQDPLGDKIARDETAIGLILNDVYTVDLAAHMGFDWFFIDQMFTPHDWSEVDRLMRAGEAAGITPVLRIQSNPWLGYDHRLAVDVTRALGIGFQYVLISNSGKAEMEECAVVSRDWHRKAAYIHPFDSFSDWEPRIEEMGKRTHVIPQPETKGGLEELLDTLDIPEINIAFIAMTDASRVLSDSQGPNWYSDRLWSLVDDAVAKAKGMGKVIGANTSYAYDMEEMGKRVVRLHEHGVRMIMVQGLYSLVQIAVGGFLREVKDELRETARQPGA